MSEDTSRHLWLFVVLVVVVMVGALGLGTVAGNRAGHGAAQVELQQCIGDLQQRDETTEHAVEENARQIAALNAKLSPTTPDDVRKLVEKEFAKLRRDLGLDK